MAEAGKKVEVRLGTFSCSIEGYDNPVEQMREVLLLMQQMIRETPALADRGPGFGEAEVARIEDALDGRAAREGDGGPGILVIRAPETGLGARAAPEDAVTTGEIPPPRRADSPTGQAGGDATQAGAPLPGHDTADLDGAEQAWPEGAPTWPTASPELDAGNDSSPAPWRTAANASEDVLAPAGDPEAPARTEAEDPDADAGADPFSDGGRGTSEAGAGEARHREDTPTLRADGASNLAGCQGADERPSLVPEPEAPEVDGDTAASALSQSNARFPVHADAAAAQRLAMDGVDGPATGIAETPALEASGSLSGRSSAIEAPGSSAAGTGAAPAREAPDPWTLDAAAPPPPEPGTEGALEAYEDAAHDAGTARDAVAGLPKPGEAAGAGDRWSDDLPRSAPTPEDERPWQPDARGTPASATSPESSEPSARGSLTDLAANRSAPSGRASAAADTGAASAPDGATSSGTPRANLFAGAGSNKDDGAQSEATVQPNQTAPDPLPSPARERAFGAEPGRNGRAEQGATETAPSLGAGRDAAPFRTIFAPPAHPAAPAAARSRPAMPLAFNIFAPPAALGTAPARTSHLFARRAAATGSASLPNADGVTLETPEPPIESSSRLPPLHPDSSARQADPAAGVLTVDDGRFGHRPEEDARSTGAAPADHNAADRGDAPSLHGFAPGGALSGATARNIFSATPGEGDGGPAMDLGTTSESHSLRAAAVDRQQAFGASVAPEHLARDGAMQHGHAGAGDPWVQPLRGDADRRAGTVSPVGAGGPAAPLPTGAADERTAHHHGDDRGRFSSLLARLGRRAPAAEPDRRPEPDPVPDSPASAADASPADLAERARARTVPDLLAVAAAWLTLVEGKPRFTRREVMETFERLPGDHPRTLEARIKGFGQLVRSSTLILVDDGVFAMAQSERDRFQAMIDDG